MSGRHRRFARIGTLVAIRRPRPRDESDFLEMVRRSRSLHDPWVEPPADVDAYRAYVRHLRSSRYVSFLVCERRSGEIAGVVSLSEIVRGLFQSAYMGFYGAVGHEGKGFMTEGVGLTLEYAFETIGLHRVEANVQPGNARSLALVERCGFQREGYSRRYLEILGEWRDHERWAVLAEDLDVSR